MMTAADINKNEYSRSVTECFKNSGRLMLVDYSKVSALENLKAIFEVSPPSSMLLVAQDAASAKDYADGLSKCAEGIRTVVSLEGLRELVGYLPTNDTELRTTAASLHHRFKYLIVSARNDNDDAILHKVLCQNSSRSGTYANETNAPFCLSDFLAECGYETVVVDDIFSTYTLTDTPPEKLSPTKVDMITLAGTPYYSPVNSSYKRIERLVLSGERRILISDTAFTDSVIQLYSALNLLSLDFSPIKMRRKMASSMFEEYCERVSTGFSYCCGDDSCISDCMQRLRGSRGYVPTDIESMGSYITRELEYLSDEEKLLRCAAAAIKLYFNGNNPGIDAIVDMIMSAPEYMTGCLVEMFFSNKLKERIESTASSPHSVSLSSAELGSLFEIFTEYHGVYHYLTGRDAAAKVIRLKKDNSGFEYFVRRRSKYMRDDELCYSTLGDGSSDVYKTSIVARLLAGIDNDARADAPMLVITDGDGAYIAEMLSSSLGEGYTVKTDINMLEGATEDDKLIAVASYKRLRASARAINVRTAVLFDVIPDPYLMKRAVNKMQLFGAEEVYILSDYTSLGAHLMDYWQNVILDGSRYMPFDNASVHIKDKILAEYSVVAERIDSEYKLLSTIVRGGQKNDVKEFTKSFDKLLLDYTLMAKIPEDVIMTDVEYLAKVGTHFDGIFKNTVTIGDAGDGFLRESFYYEKEGKGKKSVITVKSNVTERTTIFFNACPKRLANLCSFREVNCAECEDGGLYLKNDVKRLGADVRSFFEKTLTYDARMEDDKILGGGTISTVFKEYVDEEEDDDLIARQIAEWRKEAEAEVAKIEAESAKHKRSFIYDYSGAELIRDAAYKTYRKMIRKYYITLRDLFDSTTKKAIEAYRAASDSRTGTQNV